MRTTGISVLAAAATVLSGPTVAAPAGDRFDGQWNTLLTCPASRDAARYNFEFVIVIKNGVLHGEHGTRGDAEFLTLDGTLQDDGSAQLIARGLTGSVAYSVGNVRPQTPYMYHVDAKFSGTSGHGSRLELRPCVFTFAKS